LATAIDPSVRDPAPSAGPGNTRPCRDPSGTVSITRFGVRTATSDTVTYATLADIQSRLGTFDSPTRWTYWRVQSAGTLRRVPIAEEGRELPG